MARRPARCTSTSRLLYRGRETRGATTRNDGHDDERTWSATLPPYHHHHTGPLRPTFRGVFQGTLPPLPASCGLERTKAPTGRAPGTHLPPLTDLSLGPARTPDTGSSPAPDSDPLPPSLSIDLIPCPYKQYLTLFLVAIFLRLPGCSFFSPFPSPISCFFDRTVSRTTDSLKSFSFASSLRRLYIVKTLCAVLVFRLSTYRSWRSVYQRVVLRPVFALSSAGHPSLRALGARVRYWTF